MSSTAKRTEVLLILFPLLEPRWLGRRWLRMLRRHSHDHASSYLPLGESVGFLRRGRFEAIQDPANTKQKQEGYNVNGPT